jgi:hypothetical protein
MYTENWKEMCGDDQKLIAHVTATVVKDEFNPRTPNADDIDAARVRMAALNNNTPSLMGPERILPSAPDKLVL